MVAAVLHKGESLTQQLASDEAGLSRLQPPDQSLAKALAFGALRHYPRWQVLMDAAMNRPLKRSETVVRAILAIGMYQLLESRIPAHAAVSETVGAVHLLDKGWAKGLVNAVLRRVQREPEWVTETLSRTPWAAVDLPQWLWSQWRRAWPDDFRRVVTGSNMQPPMTLRVNRRHLSAQEYLVQLQERELEGRLHPLAADAVVLEEPVHVTALPGFEEGWVSVQDAAAQLAVDALDPQPGDYILDACAAPGGKTCHLLERCPDARVVAADVDQERMRRVDENLQRLSLEAQQVLADLTQPPEAWASEPFDRILLDAPCSATGVIRRHPDIKVLRRLADIEPLVEVQSKLLDSLWPLLKPGGRLLYATCSTLPQENEQQVEAFLLRHTDARVVPLPWPPGLPARLGWQSCPGWQFMDGFYYAAIIKQQA
jgi:16S rRNA (cytosine967-C5)-methyltransferase